LKKYRNLAITLLVFILATGVSSITTAHPTYAVRWYVRHSPFFLTHKVRLTRNVTFKEFKHGDITADDYLVATKRLKKGTIIKVKKGGANYAWIVSGHGMKNKIRESFWMYSNPSSKWFTTNLHKR